MDKSSAPVRYKGISGRNFSFPDRVTFVLFMKRSANDNNRVLAGEILVGILASSDGNVDFNNLRLNDSHITALDVSTTTPCNLTISQSIIEEVNVTGAHPKNTSIVDCIIGRVDGVSRCKGSARMDDKLQG